MSTEVLVKKLNIEVKSLRRTVRGIEHTLFAAHDPEGEYKPAFVVKMLKRLAEKGPLYRFTGKADFLKHVRAD